MTPRRARRGGRAASPDGCKARAVPGAYVGAPRARGTRLGPRGGASCRARRLLPSRQPPLKTAANAQRRAERGRGDHDSHDHDDAAHSSLHTQGRNIGLRLHSSTQRGSRPPHQPRPPASLSRRLETPAPERPSASPISRRGARRARRPSNSPRSSLAASLRTTVTSAPRDAATMSNATSMTLYEPCPVRRPRCTRLGSRLTIPSAARTRRQ
jgi:hypothetical protein